MLKDPVQVAVLVLHDLMQPVRELHVGISSQFAEYRGAFNRLVSQRIQLAEKCGAADLRHCSSSLFRPYRSKPMSRRALCIRLPTRQHEIGRVAGAQSRSEPRRPAELS